MHNGFNGYLTVYPILYILSKLIPDIQKFSVCQDANFLHTGNSNKDVIPSPGDLNLSGDVEDLVGW